MSKTISMARLGVESQHFEREVTCPAGERINPDGVPGCFCKIERSVISSALDPSSLVMYCMSSEDSDRAGHVRCSTWRADKENRWRRRALVEQNHARRPERTLVDQARRGDDVPEFVVPRS